MNDKEQTTVMDVYDDDHLSHHKMRLFTTKLQDLTELCSLIALAPRSKMLVRNLPTHLKYLALDCSRIYWLFIRNTNYIVVRSDWREVLRAMKSGYERFLYVRFHKTIINDGSYYTASFFGKTLFEKYAQLQGEGADKQTAYERLMVEYRLITPLDVRQQYAIIKGFKKLGATKWVE